MNPGRDRVGQPTGGLVELLQIRYFLAIHEHGGFSRAEQACDASLPVPLHALEHGEIDIAVLSTPQGLPDAFRSEPLYTERYVVVFPPGHRFERLNGISLADVSGEDYVDRLACEFRESVMAACGQRK